MNKQPRISTFYSGKSEPQVKPQIKPLMGPNKGMLNFQISTFFTIVKATIKDMHGWVGQSDRNHAEHYQPLMK